MKNKIAILAGKGLVSEEFLIRAKNIIKKRKVKIIKHSNIKKIKNFEIIINCKSAEFSCKIHKKLEIKRWNGYWLDFSSFFRISEKSIICLDPINKKEIYNNLSKKKIFCGANCTVSILLIAIGGLIKKYLIKKIFCSTYQAISGEGYLGTKKMIKKNNLIRKLKNKESILHYIKKIYEKSVKQKYYLNFSLIPQIGNILKGDSEEEKKAKNEASKILNYKVRIFSTCVRVNVLRCHSESVILKINKDISISEFKNRIRSFKNYVKIVKESDIKKKLTPTYVSGKRFVYVGRIRKLYNKTFSIFIVGDQLIWGAVEPIYRMLKILINENK
ncbi:aspartate-semialdehyde dehydrogenase [Candidatus Vidania fulgoroideorum]